MGTDAALMLAQSLKAREREDATTFGLAKKVRVEETDLAVFCLDSPKPVLMPHLRPRGLPGACHREGKPDLRKKIMPTVTVRGNLTSERSHACRHREAAKIMAQQRRRLHVLRR